MGARGSIGTSETRPEAFVGRSAWADLPDGSADVVSVAGGEVMDGAAFGFEHQGAVGGDPGGHPLQVAAGGLEAQGPSDGPTAVPVPLERLGG